MTKGRVLIGDYLGTIEEYVPGRGTYSEEGKIYASNIGEVFLDREKHIANVRCKYPAEIENGQIVFGEVTNIRKSNVTVIVKKIKGFDSNLDIRTEIHVSNISNGYIEKPERVFGIGDIVKARVVKINGRLIDISTKGNLGVVKAFCKRCRHPLVRPKEDKNKLICNYCGNRETRKTASDYGAVADL